MRWNRCDEGQARLLHSQLGRRGAGRCVHHCQQSGRLRDLAATDPILYPTCATMLMSDADLKSHTDTAYRNEELKSLTRHRFDKVRERAKLKQSVSRPVNILLPELETPVPTLHMASAYAVLSEFPGAKKIADAHLTRFKTFLLIKILIPRNR